MSWQRAAISKEYLSQTLRMQWVMATWCLKITQRLPLPAGGGHNPDAIHCRCIRTSCHVHWFAMTRRCIFMTGTLGVLEILLLFCQGQWNHSSILIVYIHTYIYIYIVLFLCIYICMYVCIHIYSTFHSSNSPTADMSRSTTIMPGSWSTSLIQ